MSATLTGSCLCGNVRFETSAPALFQGFCQCLDCRKIGAGHYAAIGLSSPAVKVSGETRRYAKNGDSGKPIYRNFCANCGSMVFDTGEAMPGITIVNAALLDDPLAFKPQSVVYARSALPWDHLDPSLPRFQTLPPTS